MLEGAWVGSSCEAETKLVIVSSAESAWVGETEASCVLGGALVGLKVVGALVGLKVVSVRVVVIGGDDMRACMLLA